jgi:hypothetical protein
MTHDDIDRDLLADLHRLAAVTEVPPADPHVEAELLAAFDDRSIHTPTATRGWGWLGGLAAAAALLIASVAQNAPAGRTGGPPPPDRTPAAHGASVKDLSNVRPGADAGEFLPWPGSAGLPPLESGVMVRIDLPVTMLPSLGVAPPATHVTAVKADVIVGQDGFARAVRFVGN